MGKFHEQVLAFESKAEKRFRAVARTAVQDTVKIAQKPRDEGGKMPVITGFLRASQVNAIGSMPSGQTEAKKDTKYTDGAQISGETLSVTLLKWDPNKEILFVGWSAAYARRIEYGFYGTDSLGREHTQDDVGQLGAGFMRSAAELWDQTVRKAVRKVESGFG